MAAMSRLDAPIKLDGKAKTSLGWLQDRQNALRWDEVGEIANTPREGSSYQIKTRVDWTRLYVVRKGRARCPCQEEE
jgi:hypothetical protein